MKDKKPFAGAPATAWIIVAIFLISVISAWYRQSQSFEGVAVSAKPTTGSVLESSAGAHADRPTNVVLSVPVRIAE